MEWSLIAAGESRRTESQALRVLYEQQAGPLYSYVQRLLSGDCHRAEDIVQETLLRCWQRRDLRDDAQSLRPWLFRVARNLVMDDYRGRRARPQEVDGTSWLSDVCADADGIEQLLSEVVVGRALRTLSARHREVLYETYFLGRTTHEAAVALGVPQGTVKSRVYYALRALKTALSQQGVQPPTRAAVAVAA